jgi:predicted DNA-binding ribbon-helix-helix protein
MCEIFVKADPQLYEYRSRSVRIHGVVTSLRLESMFWDILDRIAERDRMTVPQLIAKLYDEVIEYRGDIPNFASFLRVCCLRFLDPELPHTMVAVSETRATSAKQMVS